jgi:GNAT superfamily N-acetyltransferase
MNAETTTPAPAWTLRPATLGDVEPIAELRATVMRADLERLGRYDEHRVRQRLRDHFSAPHTWVVEVGGVFAGCVTVRPVPEDPGRHWLENFYLDPRHQGRGVGTGVLRALLARADAAGVVLALQVLQGSAARPLYERHGFTVESEDPIDVWMARRPVPGHQVATGSRV